MQGDSYFIPLEISTKSGPADGTTFLEIEVYIGDYRKLLSKDEIVYDPNIKMFKIKLTQEETFAFKSSFVPVQVRVKTTTGDVIGSTVGCINVEDAISEVVL